MRTASKLLMLSVTFAAFMCGLVYVGVIPLGPKSGLDWALTFAMFWSSYLLVDSIQVRRKSASL